MNLIADYTNFFYPKKSGSVKPLFPDISGVGMIGMGTATSVWNGLSTTGKVMVGAGAGAGAYAGYNWLFGKKAAPQEQKLQQQQNPIQNAPIAPDLRIVPTSVSNQYDYSQNYNINSNSPGAGISAEKKMSPSIIQDTNPSIPFYVSPSQATSQEAKQGQSSGTDMTTLAVIAAVAILGAGYLSGRKQHGKG